MTETRDLLDYEIYPNLDRVAAIRDLNPQDKGKYYLCDCPQCRKREAYIYKTGLYVKCSRLKECAFSQSLWDYIQTTKGLTNQETLQELARLAGYALPELQGYSEERAEKARERANALESALDFFKSQLWTDQGKEALVYLKSRGYTEDEIKAMELGFFPSQRGVESFLVNKGYPIDVVNSLGLKTKGFGETHRITIPYRDPVGRLKGFIVRAIEQTEPKYKLSYGLERDTLFNLHEARTQETIVVIEGYLDALIATQRGIGGISALGGARLTETQLETAIRYGARNIILSLDNDQAGQDGTERALTLINDKELRAFVVSLPEDYKDPDEFIKARGIEAFRELIQNAESGVKWKARRILSKHDLETDIGGQKALDEAIAFEGTLSNPIDSEQFKGVIRVELDISQDTLDGLTLDYREKKAGERLKNGYQDVFREGLRLISEGRLDEVRNFLDERIPELRAKAVSKVITPYTLVDLQKDISQTREGLKTGFEGLDKLITIPQEAITIVAARPSHGKTTFLMNLLLNMVKAYPERVFLYFSYEETKKQIGLKLLDILCGEIIDEAKNLIQLERYIRGNNTGIPAIEKGKEEFKSLTERGRLWIIDEPYFVDGLSDTLAYLSEKHDIGAVFVDYIQKIKSKGRYQTRQIEIQKISEQILETAKSLSIPILLGAQLGRDKEHRDKVRLDNLRESGDIEQDAHLVLGLFNEAMEKAQDGGEKLTAREVELKLTILKMRNGPVNEEVRLTFDRPILTIKESDS